MSETITPCDVCGVCHGSDQDCNFGPGPPPDRESCKWIEGAPDRQSTRLYRPHCGGDDVFATRYMVAGFKVCPYCAKPLEFEHWDDRPRAA